MHTACFGTQAAMESMNGMELNGSILEAEPALGAPISADKPSARSCSIFIKGFGPEVWLHTSSGDIALFG